MGSGLSATPSPFFSAMPCFGPLDISPVELHLCWQVALGEGTLIFERMLNMREGYEVVGTQFAFFFRWRRCLTL